MFKVTERLTASKARLGHILDDVQKSDWCEQTLYLSRNWLSAYSEGRRGSPAIRTDEALNAIIDEAGDSETGLVVFIGKEKSVAISPPFPLSEDIESTGASTGRLRDFMERKLVVGIVLLRLGRYAVGVLDGEKLVASKTDSRYVKNRHRAGGSSQRRFERSRERLIRELFDKACEVTQNVLSPHENNIDYVLMGGEKQTIGGFIKRCAYVQKLESKTLNRRLPVERPGKAALDGIAFEVWKSRVTVFEYNEIRL